MLNVEKDHLDCSISKEYLEKLLDVEKYQDILWRKEKSVIKYVGVSKEKILIDINKLG